MANSSTFQYRFDPGILGDDEAMIELQAEGALWAAQQSRESFGPYASVSRYAALVLEEPRLHPPSKGANGLKNLFGSLFGAEPRYQCRCRCLPPDENMPSPDVLIPDPCTILEGPGAENQTVRRVLMHPVYITAKSSTCAGADELKGMGQGDIVWVDRETKTIVGMCAKNDPTGDSKGAAKACAVDLAALFGEGGVPVGSNGNPAGVPPFPPYVQADHLPDYSHVENAIDASVIEKFMKDNNYPWHEEDYQLNIVGVQNSEAGPPPELTNLFDDFFTVTYKVNGETQFHIWPCTTRPGDWYLIGKPQSDGTRKMMNKVGTAFMPTHKTAVRGPGTYMVGDHRSYEAVRTTYQKLPSFLDGNRTNQYDEINHQVESVGLNLHRSSAKGTSQFVGPWSGGCQVFANIGHFMEFMTLANKCDSIWGKGHDSILGYTLVSSAELAAGWNT